MKNNLHKAFTLVELIVVITILATLATVAFISFQGYSTESRDTKRISDIATISKWLQVYLAANSVVPEPSETKTTITFSGSELVTQWYAGESVLNILRVKEAQDPIDQTFYTYATNPNNTKFQLVGFLENTQTASNFLENKLFADYSQRNIHSAWESVGIFLDDTNTPIQELWNTTVEIEGNNTVYKAVLNKQNIVTQSGIILKAKVLWAQQNLYGWRAFDPNCTIDDIQIWDQIWAGCNSTLGDWFEWWEKDTDNWTNFTGGVWRCYDYNINVENNPDCTPWNNLMSSDTSAINFFNKQLGWSKNDLWDSEFDTIWWKLYMWEDAMSACPAWWKLPNLQDWETSLQTLNNNVSCWLWWAWRICDWSWWQWHTSKDNTNNITNALKIPLSWFRDSTGNLFELRWSSSYIWFSYWEEQLPYRMRFTTTDSAINVNPNDQGYWFSVRCIKE